VHEVRTLLQDLALVLCVAAVTTVLFRRLRQPVVLGYLLAGVIVGPHVPIPLFVDMERIHTLSELGVVLVMFSVGLEFSIRKLVRVVPTSGIIGLIQISTMIWLGYLTGQAFGWSVRESVFTGAMVAISSTMVVAKVFAEQHVTSDLADTVFGVLVAQDLAAVLLLAVLTAVSSGTGLPAAVLARTAGQLIVFLLAIVIVGFLVVPRAIRAVARLKNPETLLLASIGVCFALALAAQKVGYSVALGAFLAGSLVAESGESEQVERLVRPVRDVFAAIFFVAVGMILDPKVLLEHWVAASALVVVVIVGQITSVSFGAFLSGRDLKTSVQAGMSLAQIGEFSFIIASVGVENRVIRSFLYPIAVAVAVVTTFTTPWLVRASGPVAMFVDRRLPKPLQTFVSLYGSWVEQLRAAKPAATPGRTVGRLLRRLALDALILAAITIGAALGMGRLLALLEGHLGVPPSAGRWIVVGTAMVLSSPFLFGIARLARALGVRLAAATLPPSDEGKLDLAEAPRRALVVTLQLAIVLFLGIPLLALTQPFVPPQYGAAVLVGVLAILAVSFWRGATNLHDHVQAGAQIIVEILGKQSGSAKAPTLEDVQAVLPGLGELTAVKLEGDCFAVGKTLAQINLRALSGASVITILRDAEGLKPTGREELRTGDVLALTGTHDAIEAATAILCERGSDLQRARRDAGPEIGKRDAR
jgi:monovalent cation:H+ antiporter-2, CPA2 family